jgi:transposase
MAASSRTIAPGIFNWWEHRISHGRMESINNKIKTLLRQTCGWRDERYFASG